MKNRTSLGIMTVEEAAEFLGVTSGRVRQLLNSDPPRLEGQKFGSHSWMVDRSALIKFSKIERPAGNPNFL